MNRSAIKKTLDTLDENNSTTHAMKLSIVINLVEVLVEQNALMERENQQLKDEINRLKGEQGQPNFKKTAKDKGANGDHSSEAERKDLSSKPARKPKNKKKQTVKIDRKIVCEIDKDALPADARFKGYETRVFQDIKIVTDNIEFSLPVYYSPSQKKTFIANLPKGYQGEFGPGVRALALTLYRDAGMTQPSLARFFTTFNITLAKSTLSNMLIDKQDIFHLEKEAIISAGLKASDYHHLDDTSCRVNGKQHYTHILCNPYFTAFFTQPKKDRLTLLKILCKDQLYFDLNETSYQLMEELGLCDKWINLIKTNWPHGRFTASEIENLLLQLFPNPKKYKSNRRIICEAAALIYYQKAGFYLGHLICDEAPQFNKLAKYKSLCWIHEGRHYKKLNPIYGEHRKKTKEFITRFWQYYHLLVAYKKKPSSDMATQLSFQFDELFATKTGYDILDKRIAMTLAKKSYLLPVLSFPFLALHNNPAELGARVQARMRDINLQTISEKGTRAKDTFATIVQTAKKLGVNIYNYLYDRISQACQMPALAELIIKRAVTINDST